MKDVHLICNPVSGQGQTIKVLDSIKEWAKTQTNLNLVVHMTENIGHATSITRDLTSTGQPVTILILGGDGSVNEVLNGINNFENTQIGILPFGSGNDFVKALKMTTNDAITLINEYINNPVVRRIDYMLINDKYRAINEVGLGMSAEVIGFRNKMKRFSPKMQYKIATIIKSLFWKTFVYQVSFDKQLPQEIKSMWFTMNNGICIGGGTITNPDSLIDDGLISISYIKKFKRIATIGKLAKVKKGKIKEVKDAVMLTCKEVDIAANDVVVEFDGNLLEHQNNINVKIVPNKLNLLVFNK